VGSLFGHAVASELPLARLNQVPGTRGSLRVVRATGDPLERNGELTAWSERLGQRFAVARGDGDQLVVYCSVTGSWLLDPAEGVIHAAPLPGADAAAVEHRIVSVMAPLLLAERGDLVVHASAVETPAGVVLFAGPSGRGKSTTVAALSRSGMPVLAEDGLALELTEAGAMAWAGARGIRLKGPGEAAGAAAAEYPAGLEHDGAQAPAGGRPVAALVVLDERSDRLNVRRLSPPEAAAAMAPNLFHRGGPEALRPAFASLARLAGSVPGFRASLPDDLSALATAAPRLVELATPA
jgi:hypothetical protein